MGKSRDVEGLSRIQGRQWAWIIPYGEKSIIIPFVFIIFIKEEVVFKKDLSTLLIFPDGSLNIEGHYSHQRIALYCNGPHKNWLVVYSLQSHFLYLTSSVLGNWWVSTKTSLSFYEEHVEGVTVLKHILRKAPGLSTQSFQNIHACHNDLGNFWWLEIITNTCTQQNWQNISFRGMEPRDLYS